MANRYVFNVKKPYGKLNKTRDTLFASDIKDACFKLADLIDYRIADKSYSYLLSEIDLQTSGCSNYVNLKLYNNGEHIEAFIEKMDDSILK